MDSRVFHAGGQGKGIVLVAAAYIPVEPGFANPPQAAEPCLAILVKAHKNHVAVALVPALINPPGLDAVVQYLPVNAPARKILEHGPVIRGGRRQKQVLGLFLLWGGRTGRRRDGRPADDGLHGLHKRAALDFDKIVQRAVSADPTGKPAPFAVGNPQAVMFPGTVDIAGNVDKLLRLAGLQVSE